VAVHAVGDDWAREARIVGSVSWAQIPDFALAVPGERHFIQKSIFVDQIGSIVVA